VVEAAQMVLMAMVAVPLADQVVVVVGDYRPAQALLEQRDRVMQEVLV